MQIMTITEAAKRDGEYAAMSMRAALDRDRAAEQADDAFDEIEQQVRDEIADGTLVLVGRSVIAEAQRRFNERLRLAREED